MTSHGTLQPEDVLRRALDSVDTVIEQDRSPHAWTCPSPCPAWNARAVLGHLIDTCTQISGLLHNRPTRPVTRTLALERLAGSDPTRAWARARRGLLDTLEHTHAPTIQTGRGALDRDQMLLTVAVEPLVHGWDLARALGYDHVLDPAVVEALLPAVLALGSELAATGMYAAALDAPATAAPQDRLLAAVGRTP